MSERNVKVRLTALVDGYKSAMNDAADSTRGVGKAADESAERLQKHQAALQEIGRASIVMGGLLATAIGVAIHKSAEFDQAMSNVQAATHESTENMDALRKAALKAGADTVFSATDSAQAIEELAKAGLSTSDILGGALTGALDAAAASGMGVAEAASVMATTLGQFGLEGDRATDVADYLAAGAGKAMGDVSDLAQALSQSGVVAKQFGISVEDTVGTLAAFANAGMLGSDAGTSFRTMLLRLAKPSGEAAEQMKQLGINAYSASGEFVGMQALAGQLEKGLAGLTQEQQSAALAVIFGQDAIRGANVLFAEGAAGIGRWNDKVNDSGYAAETAAIRLDNLMGDWEQFTGALETAAISMGEAADGPLRELVQGLTGLTDRFNDLPEGAKHASLWVGAVASAVALASGGFLLAVPKVAAFNAALATMGTGAQRTARLVGLLGKVAGGAAGLTLLAHGAEAAARGLDQMGDGAKTANETLSLLLLKDYDGLFKGMTKGANGVNDLKSAMDKLLASDFDNAFDRWGSDTFAWTGLTSSVGEAREQFSLIGDALADMVNRGDGDRAKAMFADLRKQFEAQGYTVEQLNEVMPQYQDALTGVANESKTAGSASGVAAGGLEQMETAAAEAEQALSDVVQALMDVGGTAMSMGDANDRALSAMNKLTEAAKVEGASLYDTNDASIAFRDSLREVEQAGRDSAQAILDNGGTLDDALASWQRSRDAVIEARVAKGEDRAEAIKWADQNMGSAESVRRALSDVAAAVNNIPKAPVINLTANTSEAYNALMDVQRALRQVTGNKSLHVSTGQGGQGGLVAGNAAGGYYSGGVKSFASGGFEPGIYGYQRGGIHKFAEEYDEAYISMNPARRQRSEAVWVQAGQRMGFGGGAPAVSVAAPAMPSELVVRDVDGALIGRMRVEAAGVVTDNSGRVAASIRARRRSDA